LSTFAEKYNKTVTRNERLQLLATLGDYLRNQYDDPLLHSVIARSHAENQWFTEDNIRNSLSAIAETMLAQNALEAWAFQYPDHAPAHPERTVGLIMAGNIPLVGFHDWLCVFVAGHRAKVKLSEKDKLLLPFLVKKMGDWVFESWEYTEFLAEGDRMGSVDAVIATGSNNTARYFEQYFGKYPNIIRRNRNSVAILDGHETHQELLALGKDVFAYFGLGCRNVSKLYVPAGYNFEPLLEALHEYREIVLHNKYKNNFDYNFTLYILNNTPHLSTGCVLLVENPALATRIATLHYEFYRDSNHLTDLITPQLEYIQCTVGINPVDGIQVLPFGTTQNPSLSDYADGVDSMTFLTALGLRPVNDV